MADDGSDFSSDIGGNESGSGGNLASTIGGLQTRTRELTGSANTFARAMTAAFSRGIVGAKGFDDVLKGLALRLSDLSLQMALKPVTSTLATGLSGLFNSLLAPSIGGTDLAKALNTAKPFAAGGVIASPSYFPLNGGLGLAGEAGPEAIMPLSRGADGKLGVAASGGSSPANVTVNIATPDAESFRRSESYLTGLVARAVARGQRGM